MTGIVRTFVQIVGDLRDQGDLTAVRDDGFNPAGSLTSVDVLRVAVCQSSVDDGCRQHSEHRDTRSHVGQGIVRDRLPPFQLGDCPSSFVLG